MAHAHKLLYLVGLGLLGLFMTGCGGEPSPPPPSVTFTITRSANPPDAIAGHAYTVFIATSLPSAIVPTDVVTSCSLTGSVPSGMTAAPGTPSSGAADYCVLSMSSASAAGTYSFTLQAADASTPAKVASQTYTLSIRPDFTFTTAALAQGVQGRTYGVAPLSQPEATNIGTTQGGLTVGNAPLTACTLVSVTPSNPGLAVALDATKTQCLLSSSSLTAPGTFSLTVSATETQITDSVTGVLAVPAASTTPVTSTLPLVANPPITLAVNLGSSWPNAVSDRLYGSGSGCSGAGGACVPAIYTATGGLGGYVFPASTPGSMPAGIVCPAVSGSATYTCSAPAPGIAAAPGTYSPSVTVTDTANAATPAATTATDPLSTRTDTLTVNAEMSVTPPTTAPVTAVTGRRYGTGVGCSGGSCVALDYKLNNGSGNYTLTGSSLTTPQDTFMCTLTSPNFFCSDAAIVGTTSPATLTFVGADAGNASTPGNTKSDNSQTLPIVPEMTVTPPSAAPVTAVTGRRYGTGAGCSGGNCVPLNYKLNNGLGNYTATGSSLTTPQDTFTCTLTSPNFFCSDAAIAGTTSPATLTFAGAETGNISTPGNTKTDTSQTLPIVPEMTVTAPTPAAAVTGRRYGTGTGCSGGSCVALDYKLNNGLGNYTLTGSSLTTSQDTFTCTLTSPNFFCSDAAIAGTTSPATLTFAGAETGNASTPGNTKADTSKSLTITPEMTFSAQPSSPLPTAVVGRLYGSGSGCSPLSACAGLTYTVPSGSGLGGYTFTPTNFPAGFVTCTTSANSGACVNSTGVTAATGTTPTNLNVSVTDTANQATPSKTLPSSNANATVDPEMTFSAQPSSPLPTAVVGRLYGSGSGCSPLSACAGLTYTVPSGSGLGGYSFTPNNFPAGFVTCTTSANSGTCVNSTGVTAATGTTPTNLNVSVADTANQATATKTITSSSVAVTVNAAFALTDNYSGAFPYAVVHRDYGIGGDTCASSLACAPIKFTASGGLPTGTGAYSFPSTTPASFPTGFSCSANSPATVYTCSASPVSLTVTPGSFSPSVTVTDSANSATPTGSKTDTGSLHVDSQIALGVNLGSTWPDGVTGRGYGTGGLIPAVYTATLGLADGYTFTPTGANPASFPTGFNCSPSSPTLTCTASPISASAGAYTPQVTVTDTANATTPAGTTTTDPCSVLPSATCSPATTVSFTIDPEIVIQNALSLPNGQKDQPYSVLFTCQAPLGTGTCGGTGSPNNAAAQYTWSASSNDILGTAFTTTMPVSNPTGDAVFAGTTTTAGSSETVTIGVADDGSTTTPSCNVAATCPSAAFSANILPSQAYVGSNGGDTVDVFDTSGGVTGVTLVGAGPTISSSSLSGGATPNYAAASTNGTYMFVADPGANRLYIIASSSETVTKIVTSTQGLDHVTGDTAAMAVGPQVVPTTGVSPDDVYAYVANAGTDNVQVIDANPTSANFGTTTGTGGPITFTGGPYVGTGATDLKVAPTFFVSSARKTHAYVVRPGGNEVCVFDAEPSSGTFKSKLTAAHSPNSDNCISLGATATFGTPAFIDVSPDGLYAFVTQTNGTLAGLSIIDTNPNSATFETLLTTIDLASLTPSCPNPAGVRVSPDGQTAWVACSDSSHQLIPVETAAVNGVQFSVGTAILSPTSTDFPDFIAFRPDGVFGLATLSGANSVLPFPPSGETAVATTGLTTPAGIDHIPNAALHIVTTTLPAATHGEAYSSSIVANGPNKYFTFTDLTTGPNNLSGLGFTLSSDGQVTSTTATSIVNSPGTYNLTIQVTDQSKPVNNVVIKTISLTIG